MAELMQVIALPSGYQRDLQLTKSAFIRGTLATVDGLRQIPSVLAEMTLNTEAMAKAIEPAMYMTERPCSWRPRDEFSGGVSGGFQANQCGLMRPI